jgi:hypothetical protein
LISKLKVISGGTYFFHATKGYGYICTSCLSNYVTTNVTFDLWMNRSGFNTFASVVNFVDDAWVPKHVNVDLFKTPNITSVALVKIVKPLLAKFKFTHKIIAYVKDKGSNLT